MQENNLFDRAQERARKRTTRGLVLLLIGLIGLFLAFYLPRKADSARPRLESLAASQGKLVQADVIWLDNAFAEGGENKRFYHFAQLPDYRLVVLSLNRDMHNRVNDMIRADPNLDSLQAAPLVVNGLVENTPTQLRPFLKQRFQEYAIKGDERLPEDDPRLLYMLTEGKRPIASYWPFLLLLPGILGLVFLYEAAANRRAVQKARDEAAVALPHLDSFLPLDQQAQLALPGQNLTIYEPFLISQGARFVMLDLNQVAWAYRRTIRYNFVAVNSFLQIHKKDKKTATVPLKGSPRKLDSQLAQLWEYLQEHHPEILLGFGKEQRQRFKELSRQD